MYQGYTYGRSLHDLSWRESADWLNKLLMDYGLTYDEVREIQYRIEPLTSKRDDE